MIMRSLFLKIFLWFWAAQVLIGASLYALAVAVQRSPEEMLRSGVGASLEARGRAAAVAYETGGREALRAAWPSPGPWPAPESEPDDPDSEPGGPGQQGASHGSGRWQGEGRGRRGGPEDRGTASLYVVRLPAPSRGSGGAGTRQLVALREPLLLAGCAVDSDARPLLAGALRDGQAALVTSDGDSWLARAIQTRRGGRYVAAIRLRPRMEEFDPFRAWGGPGPGPSASLRLLVVALTMGAVCYALARYLTAPAITLRRATQQFAEGDLTARVGPQMGRRRDELADLGRDFDRMAGRIEGLLMAERRLLADISHELRSPLARMQVALDLVQGTVQGDACKYLERIERESHRLNDLIGQLLTLSRLESGNAAAQREPVDLASLVREVVADADFEARSRARKVALAGADACLAVGDDHLLRSAIENVVRNAARYTPEGTEVEVVLRHESRGLPIHSPNLAIGPANILDAATLGPSNAAVLSELAGGSPCEQAVIRVRDSGPGVPEESLARLFDPFYRVEAARDRQSGGVGLGLSITARAVRLHGGDVAAMNADGGGLLVEIRLPLQPSPVCDGPCVVPEEAPQPKLLA